MSQKKDKKVIKHVGFNNAVTTYKTKSNKQTDITLKKMNQNHYF